MEAGKKAVRVLYWSLAAVGVVYVIRDVWAWLA